MQTITVRASAQYDVLIGNNFLSLLGEHAAKLISGRNAVIISDTNVWPLHGEKVAESLRASNFQVDSFVIPAGEVSKNLETYAKILEFLVHKQLCRNDVIIALGGGVVGDLTGFAASTYLRGISYIQLPTSLLAMVDSSVGGKTGINLPSGKNLAGTFYQPRLVLCDTSTLDTLPENQFIEGCAEVIKYSILYDKELFSHLLQNGLFFDRNAVISKCIELKSMVVAQDEYDIGARKLLNLGHTFGHAIEHIYNYQLSHGYAVAIGIAIAARAASRLGICAEDAKEQILEILNRFHLPVGTELSSQQLFSAAISDKKRTSDTVDLILPESIGSCKVVPTPLNELQSIIEAGL